MKYEDDEKVREEYSVFKIDEKVVDEKQDIISSSGYNMNYSKGSGNRAIVTTAIIVLMSSLVCDIIVPDGFAALAIISYFAACIGIHNVVKKVIR